MMIPATDVYIQAQVCCVWGDLPNVQANVNSSLLTTFSFFKFFVFLGQLQVVLSP